MFRSGYNTTLSAKELSSIDCDLDNNIIGDYRLCSLIYEGNFGRIYRGSLIHMDYPVAIKFFKEQQRTTDTFRERCTREVHILRSLRHPFVVRTFDEGCHQEMGTYVVMEWLEGDTLENWCQSLPPPTVHQKLNLFMQLMEALFYLHQQAILHRDLKPSNAMVVQEQNKPVLKLLDFGISLWVGQERITQSQETLGTPGFMAPEQIQGHIDRIGVPTDIYAAAGILFWLLTGRMVFLGTNTHEICWKHCHATPPRLAGISSDFSPGWDDLFQKAFQKNPHQRHSNIRDFQQDVLSLWQEELSKMDPLSFQEITADITTRFPSPHKHERASEDSILESVEHTTSTQVPPDNVSTPSHIPWRMETTQMGPGEPRLQSFSSSEIRQPPLPQTPSQPTTHEPPTSLVSTPVGRVAHRFNTPSMVLVFFSFVLLGMSLLWVWFGFQANRGESTTRRLQNNPRSFPGATTQERRLGVVQAFSDAKNLSNIPRISVSRTHPVAEVVLRNKPIQATSGKTSVRAEASKIVSPRPKIPKVWPKVRIVIHSAPSQVAIFQKQRQIGNTPHTWMLQQGKTLRLQLVKSGYQSCHLNWKALQNRLVVVHLVDDVGIPSTTIPCRVTQKRLSP